MDLKILATTFALVFAAELGDKTQLAILGLTAGGKSRLAVFLGATLALALTSGLAVLAGEALSRVVPDIWMKRGAGVAFLVMGVLFLVGKD
jgi:putative Ca2+/H+ antiporter (TMEM165/GDT1 family)